MTFDPKLSDPNAARIWRDYFARVETMLQPLDADQRLETVRELKSHVFEHLQQLEGQNEVSNLLDAIEKLGQPEEFLKPVVAGKLLDAATRSYNPRKLFSGLMYKRRLSLGHAVLSLLFAIGYFFLFLFLLIAVFKIPFPDSVGLFQSGPGDYVLGIPGNTTGMTDLLGLWTVPVALLITGILYVGLTKLLQLVIRQNR